LNLEAFEESVVNISPSHVQWWGDAQIADRFNGLRRWL